MYEKECLGKRPVVQHFWFGGVGWKWEGSDDVGEELESTQAPAKAVNQAPTAAPWAKPSPTNAQAQFNPNSALGPRPKGAPWLGLGLSSSRNPNESGASKVPFAPIEIPGLGSSRTEGGDGIGGGNSRTLASTGSAAALSSPFGGLPRAGSGGRKM